MTISNLFEQAQLAEAAYADFWDIGLNTVITTRDDVIARLIAKGFSAAQASEFADHWKVVYHQHDLSSGF